MAKRKLKTWVKATLIGGAVSVGILGFSSISFSNSDWVNTTLQSASKNFSEAGYNKKIELSKREIDGVITEDLTPFIEEQEEELLRLMEEYWQLKAQNYADDSQEIIKVKG